MIFSARDVMKEGSMQSIFITVSDLHCGEL